MDDLWLTLLLVGVLVASAAAAAVASVQFRRLSARNRACEADVQALRAELTALGMAGTGVGKQVGQLEQQVRRLAERQDQLELRDPGGRPYAQAIRLVHNGASVEDLMTTCALTQGEAELLVMLHGVKRAG